jgi:hypothetical protein
MLSSAETVAPWLVNVFPFMASAFPLLGIVYTMMAETITETAAEEKGRGTAQLTALAELAKQTNLPLGTLRRALTSGTAQLNPAALLSPATQTSARESETAATTNVSAAERTAQEINDPARPITGQIVAIGAESGPSTGSTQPFTANVSNGEGSPDKLQMTIEILRTNPEISDERLAESLSLKRPASALFWRRKAMEILKSQEIAGNMQSMHGSDSWNQTAGTYAKG